ncbi:MAG: WD40/YVTN/BNR-like repeat-containing protein [Janthinobacterium lividum]
MRAAYRSFLGVGLGLLTAACQHAAGPIGHWQEQPTGQTLSAVTQLVFSNPQAGWVVGGIVAPTSFGGRYTNVLLRTTAGGSPWASLDLAPVNTARGWRSFYAVNDQLLYGVADDLPLSLVPGARARFVYKSQDGGQSWQRLPSTGFFDGDLAFPSAQVGLSTYSSRIVRTADGGNTWRPVWQDSLQRKWVSQVQFATPTLGFATGNCVLKTTDQGQTWQALPWNNGAIYNAQFIGESVGFAVTMPSITTITGPSIDDSGLYRTLDGGQTWERLLAPAVTSTYAFVSAHEFYRAGRSIEHTFDAGQHWQTEYTLPTATASSPDSFVSFSFPSPEAGYAVSNNGVVVKRVP